MKLIKTILVGLIGLTMMFAQDQGQGNQQPPPEAQAYMQKYQETGDANEAFEAAAAVARANAEQGDDWDEQLFNDCKAEAKGAHDGVMDDTNDPQEAFKAAMQAACVCSGDCPPYNPSVMKSVHKYKKNDWAVDESKEGNEEWMAAYDDYDNWKDWRPRGGDDHDGQGGDHDGQGGDHDNTGGQCRYEGCDFVGSTDDDWRGHCDANPDHCRPQAGDTCGYRNDGGDACGYVFSGDEGEDHHHCDTCGAPMSSGQDMGQHCQENPDHCQGGGPGDGQGGKCGYEGCEFVGNSEEAWREHCEANPEHCANPVADAFFNTYGETQDFEAAFKAGEAVSRAGAQQEDDYDEDEFNKGRDCYFAAMKSYLDNGGDSPEGAMEAMQKAGCDDEGGNQDGNNN